MCSRTTRALGAITVLATLAGGCAQPWIIVGGVAAAGAYLQCGKPRGNYHVAGKEWACSLAAGGFVQSHSPIVTVEAPLPTKVPGTSSVVIGVGAGQSAFESDAGWYESIEAEPGDFAERARLAWRQYTRPVTLDGWNLFWEAGVSWDSTCIGGLNETAQFAVTTNLVFEVGARVTLPPGLLYELTIGTLTGWPEPTVGFSVGWSFGRNGSFTPANWEGDSSGPRMGMTVQTEGGEATTVWGWQFELRRKTDSGATGLIEIVPAIAGLEHETVVLSLSVLMGVRMPDGWQFVFGPFVGETAVGISAFAGKTFTAGALAMPVDLGITVTGDGTSVSLMVGWNI